MKAGNQKTWPTPGTKQQTLTGGEQLRATQSHYERLLEPSCSCCDAFISKRYQIAILSSIGFLISFGIRCNLGVAIIKMTSPTTSEDNKIVVSIAGVSVRLGFSSVLLELIWETSASPLQ